MSAGGLCPVLIIQLASSRLRSTCFSMASLLERLEKEGSAPLEPYGHQVGGHHLLVKYGNECICKPMDDKERGFYESFSPELRIFTPSYYGMIIMQPRALYV